MAARREFRFPTPEEEYLFDPYLKDQIASYLPSSPSQLWMLYIQNRLARLLEEEKIPYTMESVPEGTIRGLVIYKWMIGVDFMDDNGDETHAFIIPMDISTRNAVKRIDHSMKPILKEFEIFLCTLYPDVTLEVSLFRDDETVPKSWIRQNLS
jgi:hypothetical protein